MSGRKRLNKFNPVSGKSGDAHCDPELPCGSGCFQAVPSKQVHLSRYRAVMKARLSLSRSQILGFRQHVGSLDDRSPMGADSLRRAAWVGLQDSMPRAALLSIHARVTGTRPDTWHHSSLVQLWGPRFNAYLVCARDRALFTIGRLPEDVRVRANVEKLASRLADFLKGRRLPFGQAGRAMGLPPNRLRYAALTGIVHLSWDGARQPTVWIVPAPRIDPQRARLELARRYLHILGPTTPESFARWAGLSTKAARETIETLASELVPTRTPVGDAWILGKDESLFRTPRPQGLGARLLPSGDAYFLLWGIDRALLVPDTKHRAALWTIRVWPGALLMDGEIVGTWRRTGVTVTISAWRKLTAKQRKAISFEAESLPLR